MSPKASLIFTPNVTSEFYVSGGFGFHSNDARGTTIRVDPATGDAAQRVDPLVRSRGGEVGLRVAPVPELQTTISVWALTLDATPRWEQIATSGENPSARLAHVAVFDPPRDQLVVFGGQDLTGDLQDCWRLTMTGSPQFVFSTCLEVMPRATSGSEARKASLRIAVS